MKIITFSDLHLEFEHGWKLPEDIEGDVLILAGDIISLNNTSPLIQLLESWDKPVLYVTGNHEYYTHKPMQDGEDALRKNLKEYAPQVQFLKDEGVTIGGNQFFGGTMWTNFFDENPLAMQHAQHNMPDFKYIVNNDGTIFKPEDSVVLHREFKDNLIQWFETDLSGSRIVMTHHAPVINPNSQFKNSQLQPAFNSLDMIEIIEEYQPDYWIYGHTHEWDNQKVGNTQIISNPLGYHLRYGMYECAGFEKEGCPIIV